MLNNVNTAKKSFFPGKYLVYLYIIINADKSILTTKLRTK